MRAIAKHDEIIMQMILSGKSIKEVQSATGMSRAGIYKRLSDPQIKTEMNRRRSEAVRRALHKMESNLSDITDAALSIAKNMELPAQIRINAIQLLMNQADKWSVSADLEMRLRAIEEELTGQK